MSERRPALLRVSLTIDSLVVITLASALLFVAGWGYAEQWFAKFDLGLVALGLPVGYFGFYGYQVFAVYADWLLLLAGGAVILVGAGRRWLGAEKEPLAPGPRPSFLVTTRNIAALAPLVLPVLVLLAFIGVHALGQGTAHRDYDRFANPDNGFCGFPFVQLVLEREALDASSGNELEQELADGNGRLLLQSTDLLVIILPYPDDPSWRNRRPTVVIPISKVRLLELVPTYCR